MTTTRRLFLTGLAAAGAAALTGAPALAATAPAPQRVRWGCALPYPPSTQWYGLAGAQADAGQHMANAVCYQSWLDTAGEYAPFPAALVDLIRGNGTVPTVTWQAQDHTAPDVWHQPGINYQAILAGAHDPYIRAWAAAAAAWGHPLYVRLFHEMEGRWYPWGIGNNGNTADGHRQAWKRVRAMFTSAGAANVRFIWCPSAVTPANEATITACFPGAGHVTTLGVDGYNFGSYGDTGQWRTVEQVFDGTLRPVTGLFPRLAPGLPVHVCEVGCAPDFPGGTAGQTKAAWIRHWWGALPYLYPSVRVATWMQDQSPGGRDNHFEQTADTWAAFRAGVALSHYRA